MTDETNNFVRIEQQLETLIKLMALQVNASGGSLPDRSMRLHKAGLQPKEIASLLDSTPNAVSVALVKARKAAKKSKEK